MHSVRIVNFRQWINVVIKVDGVEWENDGGSFFDCDVSSGNFVVVSCDTFCENGKDVHAEGFWGEIKVLRFK